jgi:membrane protease YdiL (CAAX protease family)
MSDPEFFLSTPPPPPGPDPAALAEPFQINPTPPDLRVPWNWGDVGLFFFFYFVSTIIISVIILAGAAAVMHIGVPELMKHTTLFITLSIIGQAVASIVTMFYFWLLTRVRQADKFWVTMGWWPLDGTATTSSHALRYVFGGVGLALLSSLADAVIGEPKNIPFKQFFESRQSILMMMGLGILIAPLVEETMFRGFLYPVAARSFGIVGGIISTGVLFGGFHALQLWGAWAQIAVLMGVGIILTWIRARSKSVLASFLVHISYNTTLFVFFVIGSHGLKNLTP